MLQLRSQTTAAAGRTVATAVLWTLQRWAAALMPAAVMLRTMATARWRAAPVPAVLAHLQCTIVWTAPVLTDLLRQVMACRHMSKAFRTAVTTCLVQLHRARASTASTRWRTPFRATTRLQAAQAAAAAAAPQWAAAMVDVASMAAQTRTVARRSPESARLAEGYQTAGALCRAAAGARNGARRASLTRPGLVVAAPARAAAQALVVAAATAAAWRLLVAPPTVWNATTTA
mmetsp:Transcript_14693/g.43109  ORF Transcript_14693/g.43109 Transcript_14693/m.43109 type:complete len:231 (+) Transcript_14693:469-1161(+)